MSESARKYLVVPDWVVSANDGERHFIGAAQLMRLYGVNPRECVVWNPGERQPEGDFAVLRPRREGNYSLPAAPG